MWETSSRGAVAPLVGGGGRGKDAWWTGGSCLGAAVVLLLLFGACSRSSSAAGCKVEAPSHSEKGEASYYADSLAGKLTANGETYAPDKLTAAHRTLPFGTVLCVTNLSNGRSVEVTVNDRGPFVKPRVIDLSRRAAEVLDLVEKGHTPVRIDAP
jgi:rare lipoprotein A